MHVCCLAMVSRGLLLLLGLLLGVAFASPDGNHSEQVCQPECPTWFVPAYNNGTMSCVCGDSLGGAVQCAQNSNVSLFFEYCMTYDEVNNSMACNDCPYHYHTPDVKGLYVTLPQNVCDLNEFMCGELNRTGLLCSHCKPGLGPAVFSYTLPCLKCLDRGYGWLLYMFLATFPTTVMFLVIILCQIHITAPPLNAFIFVCQILVSLVNASPRAYTDASGPTSYLVYLLLTIYGIFNLDFLRYIIPPFCVSSTMTAIQALSLEYIVAFYPLLLTVALYICIQLHARDCKPLVYLWKPFHKCFRCISQRWSPSESQQWNPSKSLIRTFAAFLVLSYSKILFVSFSLLHDTGHTLNINGEKVGPLVVYYNATVPYFGTEHLPYALLALSVLAIFIVLPVLILLLYPTTVFQRCIGCCCRRWLALDAFVDAFQGHYRDVSIGAPDWRYFSGLYLIFRIMAIATNVLPNMTYRTVYRVTCYSFASLFFGLLQPYKESWVNYLDSIAFMLFSLGEFVVIYETYITRSQFIFAYGLSIVPLVYLIAYTSYKLLSKVATVRRCALRCMSRTDEDCGALSVGDVDREVYTDSDERKPLLTAASDLGGTY